MDFTTGALMSREDGFGREPRRRYDRDYDYVDDYDDYDRYDRRRGRRKSERERDEDQLKVVSVLHYVFGGITCFFGLIPIIHVIIGFVMINAAGGGPNAPPPEFQWMGYLFVFLGSCVILYSEILGALAIISAGKIRARKSHMFSLVVAGIACLQFPLGTGLGVFTFVVLTRDSVRQMYEDAEGPARGEPSWTD